MKTPKKLTLGWAKEAASEKSFRAQALGAFLFYILGGRGALGPWGLGFWPKKYYFGFCFMYRLKTGCFSFLAWGENDLFWFLLKKKYFEKMEI